MRETTKFRKWAKVGHWCILSGEYSNSTPGHNSSVPRNAVGTCKIQRLTDQSQIHRACRSVRCRGKKKGTTCPPVKGKRIAINWPFVVVVMVREELWGCGEVGHPQHVIEAGARFKWVAEKPVQPCVRIGPRHPSSWEPTPDLLIHSDLVDGHGAFTGVGFPWHPAVAAKLDNIFEHKPDPKLELRDLGQHLHPIEVLAHEDLETNQNSLTLLTSAMLDATANYVCFTKITGNKQYFYHKTSSNGYWYFIWLE